MNIPIKRYWTLLHTYLKPQWRRMIGLAVLLALKIALQLVNPQIMRRFLDGAFAGAPLGDLVRDGADLCRTQSLEHKRRAAPTSVTVTVA